jgi:phosphonate transport system substrate-binding protein
MLGPENPIMNRRTFLSLLLTGAAARVAANGRPVLRIGLTPVTLVDSRRPLADWARYLSERLHRPVEFVVRQTYQEITQRLLAEDLDIGWICGLPYVRNKHRLRLLATPLYEHKPLYRSYLIVPASDHKTTSLADLKGGVFAYVSPDSNSGWLIPQVDLRRLGVDAKLFFRKTFFAGDHRDVVDAVASGLADGGAMDGYIWETLSRFRPEAVRNTRVVAKSNEYGFPPFVARASLPEDEFVAIQRVLREMADDPQGKVLLDALNLTGFVAGSPRLYQGIEDNLQLMIGG